MDSMEKGSMSYIYRKLSEERRKELILRATNSEYRKSGKYLIKKRERQEANKNKPVTLYHMYKGGAKRRGFNWNLTKDQFYSFWKKPCHYCGSEIKTIGLDRKNTKIGYFIDNVTPCCSECNKSKLDRTIPRFIEHCARVINHYKMCCGKS